VNVPPTSIQTRLFFILYAPCFVDTPIGQQRFQNQE
jgi:hypothetical protein